MTIKVSEYIEASQPKDIAVAPPGWHALLLIAMALVAGAVYANMTENPFVLRDVDEIVHNEQLRELGTSFYGHRPITNFTFGLNYGFGELGAFGYHAVSLVLHVLVGLTLYGVIRRTLNTDRLREHFGSGSTWIAFACALLWLIHPLQTEVVSYAANRADSLMALFYLLTMYGIIRGATCEKSFPWYLAAVAACALGMGSKATMVTAPIVVLLFDRIYLARSVSQLIRRRGWVYVGLAATWLVLVGSGVAAELLDASGTPAGAGGNASVIAPWEYAITQPGVILQYLKLSFWPQSLCVDYHWNPVRSLFGPGSVPILIFLAILVWTIVTLLRRPTLGFVAVWFFLTLAPTSSIIPHLDPLSEQRMYLPLAAVVVLVVLVVHAMFGQVFGKDSRARLPLAGVLMLLVTPVLAYATMMRNQDYRDDLTMWRDVTEKRPYNFRGPLGVGRALKSLGEFVEAETAFRRAVELDDLAPDTHFYLGDLLFEENRHREAFDELYRSNELGRADVAVFVRLGRTSKVLGRYDAAVAFYDKALEIQPGFPEALYQRGDALTLDEKAEEAIESYRRAIAAAPNYFEPYQGISITLSQLGRFQEALHFCDEALRIRPGDPGATVQRRLIVQKLSKQEQNQ